MKYGFQFWPPNFKIPYSTCGGEDQDASWTPRSCSLMHQMELGMLALSRRFQEVMRVVFKYYRLTFDSQRAVMLEELNDFWGTSQD